MAKIQQKYNRPLWLAPPRFTGGLLSIATHRLSHCGVNPRTIQFRELTAGCLRKRTKTKWIAAPERADAFHAEIRKFNPDFIIINDKAALYYITDKYLSLALTRGGIYYYSLNGKQIPCLVIDDVRKTKTTDTGTWVLTHDCNKLKRWLTGTCRPEPEFEYEVIETAVQLASILARFTYPNAIYTCDIETSHQMISCVSYAIYQPDDTIKTFVIPFIDTIKPDGCYWDSEAEEIAIWEMLQRFHVSHKIYACCQNGQYDMAYFFRYNIPIQNYFLDTLHLCHSIWTEAPKRLDFIASMTIDNYTFWKDEGKEDAKEDDKRKIKIPQTKEGLGNYWRYCSHDSFNTLLILRFLAVAICRPNLKWAFDNYIMEISQQFGPAFLMSMQGIKVNKEIQSDLHMKWLDETDKARTDLLTMVDDPDYNPNSPKQNATLIYDILKATPVKRGKLARSTGEPFLKLIQTENYLLNAIIEQIWATKKPANNASKYGNARLHNGRYLYQQSAAGTETGRYATKEHQFWCGGNIQNVPRDARIMLEADPGYVLFERDYSQSDAYFTAFESEDARYMATMLSDKDVHCVHAAQFFKKTYDDLYAAHKRGEDWVDHPTKGIRQNTKRVVYGANYLMHGYTLFLTMTKPAVVETAISLGYSDAGSWDNKPLIGLCTKLLEMYFTMYPALKPAIQESAMLLAAMATN